MDDRWFRLGDHGRYPDWGNLLRKVRLFPVREVASGNFRSNWRYREQILGSLLHWAHDANASRIEFDPTQEEPFSYFTSDCVSVTTEMGETPLDLVDTLPGFIRDAIDGHPILRPIRRLVRKLFKTRTEAQFEILPTERYSGSTWVCSMTGNNATFQICE